MATNLQRALDNPSEALRENLGRHTQFEGNKSRSFAALNLAFLQEGAFVELPANKELEQPVHLLFLTTSTDQPVASQPRNLIVLHHHSKATLIESHIGGSKCLTNGVNEIVLHDGATLEHHIWEQLDSEAYFVGSTDVRQGRNSRYLSHTFWLGGSWVRHDLNVNLAEPGGECTLNGLFLQRDGQHIDNHTTIAHQAPQCTARQLYKGVLDGKTTGVFNGRILIEKAGQQADAEMNNHNLLLSTEASINTKPELEIYADDVKASHGTTVGQLNDEAIHYLRTRGISAVEAQRILTRAFIGDMVDAVESPALQEKLRSMVNRWQSKV
ncbi:MAG: Fe-S cluster assembly protein SufD [Proteobacteria bacterium]|nr:Fe-S cluster assembly protein SufD [Pseudomonadota bacterium]